MTKRTSSSENSRESRFSRTFQNKRGEKTRKDGQARVVRDELRDIKRNNASSTRYSVHRKTRLSTLFSRNKRNNNVSISDFTDADAHVRNDKNSNNFTFRNISSSVADRIGVRDKNRTITQNSRTTHQQSFVLFFISIIIFLIALINISMVFKTYAYNVSQLNSLKNQEAQLISQKNELENDIKRWSDDSYVTAQARKRLGFVFPGERSVLVQNAPQDAQQDETDKKNIDTAVKLPWYSEIIYAIENSDKAENPKSAATESIHNNDSQKDSHDDKKHEN